MPWTAPGLDLTTSYNRIRQKKILTYKEGDDILNIQYNPIWYKKNIIFNSILQVNWRENDYNAAHINIQAKFCVSGVEGTKFSF